MEKYKIKFQYKNKTFIIRKLRLTDVNLEYINALKKEKFLTTIPKKLNIKKQIKIINKINKSKNQRLIGFFYRDRLLGTSGFQNLNKKKVNIGVFLFNKDFAGKGFGKAFISLASFYMYYFFKKKYFIAGIMRSNLKSLGAFKGAGFKLLNKKKESLNFFLKIESKKYKIIKRAKLLF